MLSAMATAARSVARRPGLALTVVFTLALGIGANSAIFSAVDTVLLKPLPYPHAERLVAVHETNPSRQDLTSFVAPARIEDWNRLSRAFDALAGAYPENATETTGALPERVRVVRTSPRFFAVFGVPAALGRVPTDAEERAGGPAAMVLSDGFWRRRFAADPSVIGRTLVLGDESWVVVGVMPPSFRYPTADTEAWIPAQFSDSLMRIRQARFYRAVGRLRAGVTPQQAEEELGAVQARLGEQFPETDRGWGARVAPLQEEQVGGVRRSLWLLFAAVLLVMLAACANVACLLLADGSRREHEMAVRFALGASRRRVVRELLMEGLVLALAGAGLGLALAHWAVGALRAAAVDLPRAAELAVDPRLLAFTLALALLTTIAFALAPALQATRKDVAERLARGGRSAAGGRQRLQRVLVAAQVMTAVVLLAGSGLLVRSFARLQRVAPGFDPAHVLAFRMSAGWGERGEGVTQRQRRTLERLAAIPGVTSAGLSTVLPATEELPPAEFTIAGRDAREALFSGWRQVSAGYFETMRIPVLAGTTCRDDPRKDAPREYVVNRAFADAFFPGESPLGKEIVYRAPVRIVGVVADVREQGLAHAPEPTVYACGLMPFWPDPFHLVRVDPRRPADLGAIRGAMREIEPGRAVYSAATLVESLDGSLVRPRIHAALFAAFAAMTLLLAAIGLYGMLAQYVAGRRRDIGVRMAVGARPAQVLAHVLRPAAVVIGAGVGLGLAAALALARFMAALIFGIPAHDPATFAAVPLVLGTIAAAAAAVPARRAVRLDPVQALREE
jgi:predicted permease